ncbi:MAG: hypothetical protein NVSMB18_01430 [Acetobacteraceae bacterium]
MGAGPPPLPGVGPGDARAPVDPLRPPWRAIGRVQTELGARCTGFLTGPRTVLTAAHCLYRPGPGHFVRPGSIHFLLGYDRGAYVAHARVTEIRVSPGYDPARPLAVPAADWAALTLETALGSPDRVLPLESTPPVPGAAVVLGGYGQDRAELIVADESCRIEAVIRDSESRLVLLHGCAGTRGTSGAPLLVRRGEGWVVVGLQVEAVVGQSRGLAVAAAALPRSPGQ